jgi:hypothetical protein
MEEIKNETIVLLQNLALAQAWLENYDQLQGTRYYQTTVKMAVKRTEHELNKTVIPLMKSLFDADEVIMQEAIQANEELSLLIGRSSVEDVILASRILTAIHSGDLKAEEVEALYAKSCES